MNYDLVFKTNKREYVVKCPTNGQMIDVERLKAQYSGNNYGGILSIKTIGSNYALDMIDMNAYLRVFCKEMFEDMKVESVFDIGVLDIKPLLKDFKEQFLPWINDIQNAMRNEKEG